MTGRKWRPGLAGRRQAVRDPEPKNRVQHRGEHGTLNTPTRAPYNSPASAGRTRYRVTATITISSDVIDAVGLSKAAAFQARITTFTCVECHTPGDARTEPAVVVYDTTQQLSHLAVAHHRCAPSGVRKLAPGSIAIRDSIPLIPRAIGLPSPAGLRPALLLAYEEEITIADDSGSPAPDIVLQLLIADGLHRISALGKQPPRSPGWQVTLGPGDSVHIASPARQWLASGQMYAPPAWKSLTEPDGEVILLAGRLDNAAIYADQPDFSLYAKAVRAGQMVAGSVTIQ